MQRTARGADLLVDHELAAAESRSLAASSRVTVSGKFFRTGDAKWFVKGLTYGPFAPSAAGVHLPSGSQMAADFRQIRRLGGNCIRLYHRPTPDVLDLAYEAGLRVFVDVPWEKHRCFLEDYTAQETARREVRRAASELGDHPGLFAISVVNELPSDIVRFYGRRRVEAFIDELLDCAKQASPSCLTTFANYPSTEFVQPRGGDFLCFNVYLEQDEALAAYLDRLQHFAGSRPLILGEFGTDSLRHGELGQTTAVARHVSRVFQSGLAGSFVFSFTDDWFTGGHQIEDWAFGITRRNRAEKPAAAALRATWKEVPYVGPSDARPPRVSVVVCSFNGGTTLAECLRSLVALECPDYEVILVDDGSTDDTSLIAAAFPQVRYIRQENKGLSVARNVGAAAADGEIVAYTDSDCVADPHWLFYLTLAMRLQEVDAIGGPNVPPPSDSWTAQCVAASPGGPSHVMLDDRLAEHVPGCNMAFRRATLLDLGGFDPQFRQAGDDVDICWRLLDAGMRIGYAPAALVWHHRRNTVRAFIKQQQGYGRSEAMLLRKHHGRFNVLGCSKWRGIIYGEGAVGLNTLPPAVFHGRHGTGLFQTLYHRREYSIWAYFTLLEWHAIAVAILAGALLVPAFLLVSLVMWSLTCVSALRSMAASPLPTNGPNWCKPLVFVLHILQPAVRGWARYRKRYESRSLPQIADGVRPPAWSKTIGLFRHDLYWTSDRGRGRAELLQSIDEAAREHGWAGIFHEEWQDWDALLFGDRWHSLALRTATEQLGRNRTFTRARCSAQSTIFTRVVCVALIAAGSVTLVCERWRISLIVLTLTLALLARLHLSRRRCFASAAHLLTDAGEAAGLNRYNASEASEPAVTSAVRRPPPLAADLPGNMRGRTVMHGGGGASRSAQH